MPNATKKPALTLPTLPAPIRAPAFVVQPSRNKMLDAAWKGFKAGQKADASPAAVARPKESVVEHEGYRRLVAARPCMNCHRQRRSQAAHPPPTGKGIKADDRECFPLCCDGPRYKGCHPKFDNYELMPHDKAVKQAKKWGAQTRREVEAEGAWPKDLPRYKAKP